MEISYIATPLLMISGLPQMIKLIWTRRSGDISRATYTCTTLAIILLLIRSIQVGDIPLITANATSAIITGINTYLIFKYHD